MSFEVVLLVLRAAAVILLYAFLGVAFYLLWRDLTANAKPVNEPTDELQLLSQDSSSENGQHAAHSPDRSEETSSPS